MFAYIEQKSYLHDRNPMIKLAVIAVYTIIVCLSYYPVLPILTFLLTFLAVWGLGKIPLKNLLGRMMIFVVVSILFMISMFVLRGIDHSADAVYQIGVLGWSREEVVQVLSLGLRILALVTLSMGFVLTTRPSDLVLSLILQCKVSVVHGYATMATYRFLPELQDQVEAIHLAQEIRGVPWNKGFFSRFSSPFRVMLPLFCVAARRGERLACAMESRGLGRENVRTYYRRIRLTRSDWTFLIVSVIVYLVLTGVLVRFDLYRFNIASIM